MIGHDLPVALGGAGQIDGVEVQPDIAGHRDAKTRTQEVGIGEDQLRRQLAGGGQLLGPISIAQNPAEQTRPLGNGLIPPAPLVFREYERNRIKRPEAIRAPGIAYTL